MWQGWGGGYQKVFVSRLSLKERIEGECAMYSDTVSARVRYRLNKGLWLRRRKMKGECP